MTHYKLTTNEGTKYVRSTENRIRAAMFKYIKAKRKDGHLLASIVFCWSPIYFETI
jgi:hypothetical protein